MADMTTDYGKGFMLSLLHLGCRDDGIYISCHGNHNKEGAIKTYGGRSNDPPCVYTI